MKRIGVVGALAAALLATLLVAAHIGTASLSMAEVNAVLLSRIWLAPPPDPTAEAIVWSLRVPRALLAFVVGGGLAVVGVGMQALVRNPLAEPYLLGVSSGAAAGASLFYLGLLPAVLSRWLTLPLAAFVGAMLAITTVLLVAQRRGRLSPARLLLAGVAIAAMLGAAASFATFASPEPDKLRTVLFWLLGSFAGASWSSLTLPVVAVVVGMGCLLVLARPMDALITGEESAMALGVPVEVVKRSLVGVTALVTGFLVAASGVIGFVGLIVPHATRFLVGVRHARVLPVAFVVGGLFLVWADIAARMVLPGRELPVGVLTAICGVPFFLILLRRTERLGF